MSQSSDEDLDEDLIERARSGDSSAWNTLVERYEPNLLRVARWIRVPGLEPEDVVQETFLVAFGKMNTYRGHGRLRQWLAAIARTKVLLHVRRSRRERQFGEGAESNICSGDPSPEMAAHEKERRSELHNALVECYQALSEEHRYVFVLNKLDGFVWRKTDGLTAKEAAEALQISLATVYRYTKTAREEIRKCLQSKGWGNEW